MRKSIFDIEIRVNINYEFDKLKEVLFKDGSLYYNSYNYSLYSFLNEEVFPIWEHKGMFIDFDDFANRLGINFELDTCSEENFLYLLELLINLWSMAEVKLDPNYEKYFSKKVTGYMRMNLPLIIEKMNYQIENNNKRYRLIKRDSDVDSILNFVPDNYVELLLDYNDIRNNNLNSKMEILKKLDKYIEENKKVFKSINTETYNSIQTIVNKMGINHPLKEEPFKSFSTTELISWYDKCFKLMIHLIRQKEVNEINKKRKELISD